MSKDKNRQYPFIQRFAEVGFSPEGDKSMPVVSTTGSEIKQIYSPEGDTYSLSSRRLLRALVWTKLINIDGQDLQDDLNSPIGPDHFLRDFFQ